MTRRRDTCDTHRCSDVGDELDRLTDHLLSDACRLEHSLVRLDAAAAKWEETAVEMERRSPKAAAESRRAAQVIGASAQAVRRALGSVEVLISVGGLAADRARSYR